MFVSELLADVEEAELGDDDELVEERDDRPVVLSPFVVDPLLLDNVDVLVARDVCSVEVELLEDVELEKVCELVPVAVV